MTIEEEKQKELCKIKKQMVDTDEARALMINPVYYPPIPSTMDEEISKMNNPKQKSPGKPNPLK